MTETVDFDMPVSCVWSSYGHRFYGTGESASDSDRDSYERCLTCGGEYVLRNLGDGNGEYVNGAGDEPAECSGRTDLVHGYERVCQADGGPGCEASRETGTCTHTDHECDCYQCH